MSIENNLKKIADQLERIANAVESREVIPDAPAPQQMQMKEAEIPTSTQTVSTIETPSHSDLPPLTVTDLENFNKFLIDTAGWLGATGQDRIRAVFRSHGIENLTDIGDDRNLLLAIQTDVLKLEQEAA